jgi:hypothetical protein
VGHVRSEMEGAGVTRRGIRQGLAAVRDFGPAECRCGS